VINGYLFYILFYYSGYYITVKLGLVSNRMRCRAELLINIRVCYCAYVDGELIKGVGLNWRGHYYVSLVQMKWHNYLREILLELLWANYDS